MTTGIFIEGLVIVLLTATIVYCYILSGKLKSLKLEESMLRSTIAELMTTTELVRPTTSQPRAVSELAAEATARINALRRAGG